MVCRMIHVMFDSVYSDLPFFVVSAMTKAMLGNGVYTCQYVGTCHCDAVSLSVLTYVSKLLYVTALLRDSAL